MTWDDNRKAAAYVTAEDPAVLQFARSVTSKIRQSETRSIDDNLQARSPSRFMRPLTSTAWTMFPIPSPRILRPLQKKM